MIKSDILDLRAVSRRYQGRAAVDAASLCLPAGRIACLLGPSGCGKSTLLRMIAGLETVDEGEIHIGGALVSAPGRALPPEQRGVGLVFQDNALFPHLNVARNIGFGLTDLDSATRAERVERLLARFHIAHLAGAWPHTLSGGEQQRVAIARALAREPALLLLDEPFSGLDGTLRAAIRQSLLDDLRAAGATVLIVTHDPEEAMLVADHLILMAAGRILQSGEPAACYDHPASLAAARLLGEMITLPATVKQGVAHSALPPCPAPGLPDGPAQIALRPEALRIDAGEQGAPARLLSARRIGGGWHVELDLAGHRLALRCAEAPPAGADKLHLTAAPAELHIFSTQG
ncbi:ABC transporter ATP-binding protein [Sphingopyxis sp. MWB1]|uniref:ABC transporter ATP-binding protein n=1 Tax=Sphingopyxis sp. MWB1 TaxID=1537715 RepID=UPI00069239A7|nr:ABC transporter ATP-binding protein [Sphingopyxis sp. MWB1]